MKVSLSFEVGGKHPASWERLHDARIPSPFTARFAFPDDHTVELDVALEGETPVCNAIRIERNRKKPSLNGTELRRLPLRDLINDAVSQVALTRRENKAPGTYVWGPAADEERPEIARAADRAPRRRRITDDLLKEVASVYRANVDDNPRDAVMDVFGVKAAMASRYIKLARERGFLGAATRGKAGER